MSQTIDVVFDGEVLRPDTPLDLVPNQRYVVTISERPEETNALPNAWDVLSSLSGTIEETEDWAVEHDHYLYGAPKKQDKVGP